jgi:hypothetical protein
MVEKFEDLEDEIKRKWSGDPVKQLCLRLIHYMREQPNENLQMLTYRNIGKILNTSPLNENVLRAITILVSSNIHALEMHFLFIDQRSNREYEVDNQDIEEAKRTGIFVHPITGEEIINYESKIAPFFVPSEKFIQLKKNK